MAEAAAAKSRAEAAEKHASEIAEAMKKQQELEDQLRRAQRMEAIGQLSGGIAHDVNNLLSVILGYVDMASEETRDNPEVVAMLAEAAEAAQRGAELTHRLLAFARQQSLQPRMISMNILISELAPVLQRTLGDNVAVQLNLDKDLWLAEADPSQLQDALLNLCINARDAMPNGGSLMIATANISLDESYCAENVEVVPGDYVMMAVTDTGTGMPKEVLSRAFEPFFTTKTPDKGSGLGLSMVYGFVKQSRGHVKIYSEVGYGTSIKIYLPKSTAKVHAPEREAITISTPPVGSETILIVEDNDALRRVAKLQLSEMGYKILEASTARDALHLIEAGQEKVDIVFTDIVMPGGMNGFQLAEEISRKRPQARILFTSAFALKAGTPAEGLSVNTNFIGKPYRMQELARKIREILDKPVVL